MKYRNEIDGLRAVIGEGFRKPDAKRFGVHPPRLNPPHAAKALLKSLKLPDSQKHSSSSVFKSLSAWSSSWSSKSSTM
jgi:hypothetical protein